VVNNQNKLMREVFSIEGDVIENLPVKRDSQYTGWVNIQYGCAKFCTYCIVPYTRGKQRSRMPLDIINEVKDLVRNNIKETTILVSIMFANNEIGTIQNISEITKITKFKGVYFHTDAVQAVGNVEIDVDKLGIDALSMAAHKFYGPKGIGAAYIKKTVKFTPIITGGHQEKGKRAGTENVPAIVGMGKAIELATANIQEYNKKLMELRDYTIDRILSEIPYVKLNGDRNSRLAGSVNISFKGIEGESLLLMLDMKGIEASSGSACTSGSLDPSHVLMAIGLPHEIAHGSLRLSIGDFTTEEDIDYIIEKLPPVIERLRMMSPLYDAVLKQK
jgi:cysteine desulfurase